MVRHWFDFMCPFCYVAQHRNDILAGHGIEVVHLPYQIHPEIPVGGLEAGPRVGPMYANLEREAAAAGLPLNWPARLSNTRQALAAAEWIRRTAPDRADDFNRRMFAAYFADGEDLGDIAVIERHAGVDGLRKALADGTAATWLAEAELAGAEAGVRATPSWLIDGQPGDGQLISGLLPAAEFERLAATL